MGAGAPPVNHLLTAMMAPRFYPHPCDRVELRETLLSWLLFAGEFVYKVKKPVFFSFIDATTPARRFQLCQDETDLNRRLAPQVYLGVRGIAAGPDAYTLTSLVTDPNVRDFAVLMRRLPANRMLDRLVADGAVGSAEIGELARELAAFHARASTANAPPWGSAQAIYQRVIALEEARRLAADSLTRGSLEAAQAYLRRYVISHRQSLDNRARDGQVREGHGDLRCESICFESKGVAIIDCAEYSESRRHLDVASDLAALAIDLEALARPDLADELLEAYVWASGDRQIPELIDFYKCYQAVWRGQLQMLTSLQAELPIGQRMAARGEARQWLNLASRYVVQ